MPPGDEDHSPAPRSRSWEPDPRMRRGHRRDGDAGGRHHRYRRDERGRHHQSHDHGDVEQIEEKGRDRSHRKDRGASYRKNVQRDGVADAEGQEASTSISGLDRLRKDPGPDYENSLQRGGGAEGNRGSLSDAEDRPLKASTSNVDFIDSIDYYCSCAEGFMRIKDLDQIPQEHAFWKLLKFLRGEKVTVTADELGLAAFRVGEPVQEITSYKTGVTIRQDSSVYGGAENIKIKCGWLGTSYREHLHTVGVLIRKPNEFLVEKGLPVDKKLLTFVPVWTMVMAFYRAFLRVLDSFTANEDPREVFQCKSAKEVAELAAYEPKGGFRADLLKDIRLKEYMEKEKEKEDKARATQWGPKSLVVFFPYSLPGLGKTGICEGIRRKYAGKSITLSPDISKDCLKKTLLEEMAKYPIGVFLIDRSVKSKRMLEEIRETNSSSSSEALVIPVLCECEGTMNNPLRLDVLAICIWRVLHRHVNVVSSEQLNRREPYLGKEMLACYLTCCGKNRADFEEGLMQQFGRIVRAPLLKKDREPLPQEISDCLMKGIELHKSGIKMKKKKWNEWNAWEKDLRTILQDNDKYIRDVQVPLDSVVLSVLSQLREASVAAENPRTFIQVPGESAEGGGQAQP